MTLGPLAQRLGTVDLRRFSSATAAGDGTASFSFDSVPDGRAWLGTVAVPNAPGSASFSPAVDTDFWTPWSGSAPSQPIRAAAGTTLTVAATGLLAGSKYRAQLLGDDFDEASRPPLAPTQNPSVVVPTASGAAAKVYSANVANDHLITGAPGETIKLYGLTIVVSLSAAGSVQVQLIRTDTNKVFFDTGVLSGGGGGGNALSAGSIPADFGGVPLAAGAGVDVTITNLANMTAAVNLSYTQG